MYGRRAEQCAIAGLLAEAHAGNGGALVLRGEAGIGKSTLLRHAADLAAHPRGMRVLRCAGVESEIEQAFSGLHQLLRPLLDRLDALPAAQAEALRGALGITDSSASDFVVSAAVIALLAEAATRQPVLVVVDDLQWLDRASASALLFAARRLGTEPIATLFAVRNPEPTAVDTTDLPELQLGGLPTQDAARLLAERGWVLPSHLLESVLRATGGNPLALAELADLAERDHLIEDLAMSGTVPVSARVRRAFLRQVHALPTDCRDLLLVAAAEEIGHADTVLGAAARLDLRADGLEAANRSGLIELADGGLRFRHPLIRSAVYADASFESRSAAHRAIAAQLDADGETDRATWHRAVVATVPDEELASALERSADAVRRRGGEAATASVLQRAARLSTTSDGRRRRIVTAAFAALDSGQLGLARTLVEEVMAESVPAVTLAQMNGTIELYDGDPAVAYFYLMRCAELMALTDPEEAAWTLTLASNAAFHAGDLDASALATTRIAELDCDQMTHRAARGLAEGTLTGSALWELPSALERSQPGGGGRPWMWAAAIGWLGPDPHEACRLAEVAGQRLRALGSSASLTELLFYQADLEFRLGRWSEGIAHAEEGLRFTHETGQRGLRANLLAILARFAAVRGDGAECRKYAERALAIAVPLRQRVASAMATAALGLLAMAEGNPQEACARLAEVDTPGSRYGHQYIALSTVADLVEAAVRSDQPHLATAAVERFVALAEQRTAWVRARLHLCRALLAEDEAAEHHYRLALVPDDVADRPFNQARAALLYGQWLRRNRRRADARTQLRIAVALFDSLGAVPWAQRARTELRATGGAAHEEGSDAAALLTPQKLEVAQLAANGLSNREIGERLSLSPRTVGSHLYRLFPKLGISARSQLRDVDLG
ncbi:AAA family ATPase [Nonomuraea sp. H19]|uniref:helix-turn-helix transcriptional regulator n=1 Tax=Nonomuraea sp. H19 TaxID=3452206 RepID=UPI003F88E9A9